MNKEGQFQKAFLLPQEDPGFYKEFFYSYNRPELITGAVEVPAFKKFVGTDDRDHKT